MVVFIYMSNNEKIINSLYLQDELNPDVWDLKNDDYILNPEIRKRLLKTAQIFIEYLDVDFFVDEDISRQGKKLFGRPVVSPSMVVPGSTVYLPFIPVLATKIAARLNSDNILWAVPPNGDWSSSVSS